MSTIENFIKAANITTPNALYKWMNKNIKYGYTSKDNKTHTDTSHMEKAYVVPSPITVLRNKIGTCWDQVIHELTKINNC